MGPAAGAAFAAVPAGAAALIAGERGAQREHKQGGECCETYGDLFHKSSPGFAGTWPAALGLTIWEAEDLDRLAHRT